MTAVRFAVDGWDPRYGPANEADSTPDEPEPRVELDTEVAPDEWRAVTPTALPRLPIAFVDGVRRIEAHVWFELGDVAVAGVCGSWAAGAVVCVDGVATVATEHVELGRTAAVPVAIPGVSSIVTRHATFDVALAEGGEPEQLWLAVQEQMNSAEIRIAARLRDERPGLLLVLDGPLRGRDHLDDVVGLVKTHRRAYLSDRAGAVAASLAPGERTPVFTIVGSYARHSWYVRLPGPTGTGVPLGGTVRCECPARLGRSEVADLADTVTANLQRFASSPHKDRRAPQNLTPIAGLERLLRHRLGDPALLYRSLRVAAG